MSDRSVERGYGEVSVRNRVPLPPMGAVFGKRIAEMMLARFGDRPIGDGLAGEVVDLATGAIIREAETLTWLGLPRLDALRWGERALKALRAEVHAQSERVPKIAALLEAATLPLERAGGPGFRPGVPGPEP